MEQLERRIIQDGEVYPGNILKVSGFLNHQMDISLLQEMGREWKRRFADAGVNKILTIEASGIGIACIAAQEFGCPVVFAKKSKTLNLGKDVFSAKVESFTHKNVNDVVVDRRQAIRYAMSIAQKDDIIVLAGKGHETDQEICGIKYHLDEREEVARWCAERNKSEEMKP